MEVNPGKSQDRVGRQAAPPPPILGRTRAMSFAMGSDSKISRSPTPPEPDDDGEEWPVHGIVGEDVDVFGIPSYELRWKDWARADGTSTTWVREIDGDPAIVASWNEAMKSQRLKKAMESQSIDLISLASTPMHDRLTFESAPSASRPSGYPTITVHPPLRLPQGALLTLRVAGASLRPLFLRRTCSRARRAAQGRHLTVSVEQTVAHYFHLNCFWAIDRHPPASRIPGEELLVDESDDTLSQSSSFITGIWYASSLPADIHLNGGNIVNGNCGITPTTLPTSTASRHLVIPAVVAYFAAPGQAAIAAATEEGSTPFKPAHVNSTTRTTGPAPAPKLGDGPCAHGLASSAVPVPFSPPLGLPQTTLSIHAPSMRSTGKESSYISHPQGYGQRPQNYPNGTASNRRRPRIVLHSATSTDRPSLPPEPRPSRKRPPCGFFHHKFGVSPIEKTAAEATCASLETVVFIALPLAIDPVTVVAPVQDYEFPRLDSLQRTIHAGDDDVTRRSLWNPYGP
ncbi:hypothetical protein BJV77DRAFT_1070141 [Russula vinacea]|nr:hypothetical protein BJV77DRAFT_1070141 [Russula vinacea]